MGNNLASMLPPGLAGYVMGQQQDRQNQAQDLQAMGVMQQIQAHQQKMAGAQAQQAQLDQFRSTLPPALQNAPDFVIQEYAKKAFAPPESKVVGRTLMDSSGKVLGVDSTWQGEQAAARDAKRQELEMRLADSRTSREEQMALRRELAGQASADRMAIAGMMDARREQKNVPKLPTSALKMQQESLDAIGTSSSIASDLDALEKQIDAGALQLGPVNNRMAQARNFLGASTPESKNFASFQASLEKMRNDSLRLNKGVQTEGDAQRAWNELFANVNDPGVVKQRLQEIKAINSRAANLHQMNVETIRSNFGVDPLDTSGYQNQPAVVGNSGTPAGNAGNRKLSAEDKQALDWAMANKGDPRAVEIKSRLGVK